MARRVCNRGNTWQESINFIVHFLHISHLQSSFTFHIHSLKSSRDKALMAWLTFQCFSIWWAWGECGVCPLCAWMHAEARGACWLSSLPTALSQDLSLSHTLSQVGWPRSSQNLGSLCCPAIELELQICPAFYRDAGELNSGPQACCAIPPVELA